MKLHWNKLDIFNTAMSSTKICNFWHRDDYTSSVDGNFVKQTVYTHSIIECILVGTTVRITC